MRALKKEKRETKKKTKKTKKNMATQHERDALFNALFRKKGNKLCFDCNTPNPKWTSKTFCVFVCLDCSGVHRSLGVHISAVKSANMDRWTTEELDTFKASGGNDAARAFFSQHGWNSNERGRIAQKYTSRAANLYKERLRRECENMRRKGGGISPLQSPTDQGPKTDFFGDPLVSPKAEDTKNVKTMENYFPVSPKKNEGEEKKKEETKTKPLAASQPVHKRIAAVQTSRPKVMVSSTTRKVGLGAKKTGGLGAKKLSEKVDDRLFDQAPSEEVPSKTNSNPPSGGASPRDSSGHVALPPKSNRFAYSEDGFGDDSKKETKSTTSSKNDDGPTYTMGGLESVPVNSRRGTSGHVTLDRNAGKKTNIDTRNFGSTATSSSSSSRPPASNSTSRSAFGASPKYGNSGHGGGGFGRNTTSSASTSTNPAAVGAANDHYYNATERFAGAKSISSDAFGGGSNRSNDNDDGFGWDANRYAGESGFGSSDIRRGGTSPRGDDLDLTASDLMEKISFQAKQDAAAFKSAASRGISGLKNMASSIFDELNR